MIGFCRPRPLRGEVERNRRFCQPGRARGPHVLLVVGVRGSHANQSALEGRGLNIKLGTLRVVSPEGMLKLQSCTHLLNFRRVPIA